MPELKHRQTTAILLAVETAIFGYACLRTWSYLQGEPDPRSLGPSLHIPYFWRVATVCWWAAMAGLLGWVEAARLEHLAQKMLLPFVLLSILLMILVP
jgi:hypothetical protein